MQYTVLDCAVFAALVWLVVVLLAVFMVPIPVVGAYAYGLDGRGVAAVVFWWFIGPSSFCGVATFVALLTENYNRRGF